MTMATRGLRVERGFGNPQGPLHDQLARPRTNQLSCQRIAYRGDSETKADSWQDRHPPQSASQRTLTPKRFMVSVQRSLDSRMQTWVDDSQLIVRPRALRSAEDSHWYPRFRALLVGGDTVVVVLAVALSYLVRFGASAPTTNVGSLVEATMVASVWLLALSMIGSRELSVLAAGPEEYRRVMASSLYAFGAIAIGSYLLQADISRFCFLMALPLGTVLLLAFRWIARGSLSASRQQGKNMAPAIIVGSPSRVERAVRELNRRQEYGLVPSAACIVGSDRTQALHERTSLPRVAMKQIPQLAVNGDYRSVVVAGGLTSEQLRDLAWSLERSEASMVVFSEIADAAGPRLTFQDVAGLDLVHVKPPNFVGWPLRAKRTFDIVFSALALVLLSPVLLAIAIAIYRDDPGPIIFRQQRIGLNGKPFTIHKFRSMSVDAESKLAMLRERSMTDGPLFKMDDDPRMTRVGRVLRKYSLDELPQFWTVLRGNMSVVGPRPHLENELDEFPDEGLRRLLIKPGITGLWQVSGRSDLSLEDSVKLDLRYVQSWSLLGDITIIMKTAKAMLMPQGAY